MIKQCLSKSSIDSQKIHLLSRNKNESNVNWLERAYHDLNITNPSQWNCIVLTGGKDIASFRIRVAQSYLRGDMLPSFWSDCGLLKVNSKKFANSKFYYLPLLQPSTDSYAPKRNGLVEIQLNKLFDQREFPNLALLAIPVAQKGIFDTLKDYKNERIVYDAVENILPWLAYVWGIGNATNPLMQQIGFPSAMMLSQLFSVHNFDLAPGANGSLSSPEVFWSGVKHWQDFYSKTQENGLLPEARYVTDHIYDIDEN